MAGRSDTEQDEEALVQGYKMDIVTLLENERTTLLIFLMLSAYILQ